VRGIPSPFIKIYKRGRDTPHPSLLPLLPMRKDFLEEVLAGSQKKAPRAGEADRGAKIDYGEGKLELYAAGNSVTS
jgi:hypothetical protein